VLPRFTRTTQNASNLVDGGGRMTFALDAPNPEVCFLWENDDGDSGATAAAPAAVSAPDDDAYDPQKSRWIEYYVEPSTEAGGSMEGSSGLSLEPRPSTTVRTLRDTEIQQRAFCVNEDDIVKARETTLARLRGDGAAAAAVQVVISVVDASGLFNRTLAASFELSLGDGGTSRRSSGRRIASSLRAESGVGIQPSAIAAPTISLSVSHTYQDATRSVMSRLSMTANAGLPMAWISITVGSAPFLADVAEEMRCFSAEEDAPATVNGDVIIAPDAPPFTSRRDTAAFSCAVTISCTLQCADGFLQLVLPLRKDLRTVYFTVTVGDASGNSVAVPTEPVRIDLSPPRVGYVHDGVASGISRSNATSSAPRADNARGGGNATAVVGVAEGDADVQGWEDHLGVSWFEFSDEESGISAFCFSVARLPERAEDPITKLAEMNPICVNDANATYARLDTPVGLLVSGQRYAVGVTAVNGYAIATDEPTWSNSILVDTTPPVFLASVGIGRYGNDSVTPHTEVLQLYIDAVDTFSGIFTVLIGYVSTGNHVSAVAESASEHGLGDTEFTSGTVPKSMRLVDVGPLVPYAWLDARDALYEADPSSYPFQGLRNGETYRAVACVVDFAGLEVCQWTGNFTCDTSAPAQPMFFDRLVRDDIYFPRFFFFFFLSFEYFRSKLL
jgi:hypothetical protein